MQNDKKISRRSVLKGAIAAAGSAPLAMPAATSAFAKEPKQSKQSVSYRELPNEGKHCSICGNFLPPSSCKLVEGSINPNGWCGLFKPKD
jgi:uncharacterized low-complexity protein